MKNLKNKEKWKKIHVNVLEELIFVNVHTTQSDLQIQQIPLSKHQ
jgi:hypothetical protein